VIASPNEFRGRAPMRQIRKALPRSDQTRTETALPVLERGGRFFSRLAQTARIDDPITSPTQTRSAKMGVKAGHHAPESDSNHTGLPLGTGPAAGRPKRTRYVVA
jgi:hypothetical protein